MEYTFYYSDSNVTQIKLLISFFDYQKFKILPNDSKKEEKRKKEIEKQITKEKEWFTNTSPLFRAIFTQILDCNGYEHKCIIKPIIQ